MNEEPDGGDRALGHHRARKRFGQHFLHDPYAIERILRAINPQPRDSLVEIGPGLGALTQPLLKQVIQLHVVELDRDVIPHLQAACGQTEALRIHLADALEFDYSSLINGEEPLRIVGNLPYNISTPLLFHLLGFASQIRDMHFMLQKEVVDRIVAAPGDNDYGRLTATIAARARSEILFDVGPGAFRPPPKVMSAVVRLTPRVPDFPITNLRTYDRVVTAAFSQRRKTLTNSLRSLLTAAQISDCGIDPGARAETLSPAEFSRLSTFIDQTPARP